MSPIRPGSLRRPPAALGWLVLGSALAFGADASAQHTPDPYNIVGEYNRQYEPYLYAVVPDEPGQLPNENRSFSRAGNRNANQFQNFLEGDDAPPGSGRTAGGAGVPYYRAGRQVDAGFQKPYKPKVEADKQFYDQQKKRSADYQKALGETDPKKKAELLRAFNRQNEQSARTLSNSRSLSRDERDKELKMDRFTPGTSLFGGDDDEESAPPPTRRSATTPSLNGRTATGRGATTGRTAPARGTGSAADLLRRSDALGRSLDGSAPPPPSGYSPR